MRALPMHQSLVTLGMVRGAGFCDSLRPLRLRSGSLLVYNSPCSTSVTTGQASGACPEVAQPSLSLCLFKPCTSKSGTLRLLRGVAQLAARMHGVHEVPGSSPGTPTMVNSRRARAPKGETGESEDPWPRTVPSASRDWCWGHPNEYLLA